MSLEIIEENGSIFAAPHTWTAQQTFEVAGLPLILQNTTDAASNEVLRLKGGNRGTPADGDEVYVTFYMEDDTGTLVEYGRITCKANDVTNTTQDAQFEFALMVGDVLTPVFTIDSSSAGVVSTIVSSGAFIIAPDAGGTNRIYFYDKGGEYIYGDGSDLYIVSGGNIFGGNTATKTTVIASSSHIADDGALFLAGGHGTTGGDGGTIFIYGGEHASLAGSVKINAGNSTTKGDIVFSTAGVDRFKFDGDLGYALVTLDYKICFGDGAVYIFSNDDGYLDLVADTGIRAGMSVFTSYRDSVENHTANDTLTTAETGSVHTNYGEDGEQTLTLPASAAVGTTYKFKVAYAGELRVKISAAGGSFIVNGATSTDDGGADLYVAADDEGEFMEVTCIGTDIWLCNVIGTWTVTQP